MAPEREAAFWCVAPACVIKAKDIGQSAKLLYVLITALQVERGYCYASNKYLAEGIGLDAARSIPRLLDELSGAGYITVKVVRDKRNTVIERRIFPAIKIPALEEETGENYTTPHDENVMTPHDGNVTTHHDENVMQNIVDINILPPKAPQGGRKSGEVKKQPDHKPERFAKLWEYYPKAGRKKKQAAIKAWDKLKPSDELINTMARALREQKRSELWSKGIGIPYVSAWLNGARWEDEPDGADTPEEDSDGGEYFSGCPEDWEVNGA